MGEYAVPVDLGAVASTGLWVLANLHAVILALCVAHSGLSASLAIGAYRRAGAPRAAWRWAALAVTIGGPLFAIMRMSAMADPAEPDAITVYLMVVAAGGCALLAIAPQRLARSPTIRLAALALVVPLAYRIDAWCAGVLMVSGVVGACHAGTKSRLLHPHSK